MGAMALLQMLVSWLFMLQLAVLRRPKTRGHLCLHAAPATGLLTHDESKGGES
jgi:hypothetical protein